MSLASNRIHRHLGLPPRPLEFADVVAATESRLEESEDLDWKVQLPEIDKNAGWDEFSKDVAAMANTAGGILVYGVTDQLTVKGLNVADPVARLKSLLQRVSGQVKPPIAGVETALLQEAGGERKLLVVAVPESEFAP